VTFEQIKAEVKAFTAIQWVMVLAVAVVFGFALDGLWAVIIGAVVVVILVMALARSRPRPPGD
jgi:O-antigen/teichoic acid export membrane protein